MTVERINVPDGMIPDEYRLLMVDQLDLIEKAINEVIGVVRRRTIPEKPREGQIYYLVEDLNDGESFALEGFWVSLNDEWYTIDLTLASELPPRIKINDI